MRSSLTVTGNITSAARISVFQPSTSNIAILVIYLDLDVFQKSLCFIGNWKASNSCAHTYKSDWASMMQRLFSNFISVEVLVYHVFSWGGSFPFGMASGIDPCGAGDDACGGHVERKKCRIDLSLQLTSFIMQK
jgi:hypothetical protein